jgi:hypothetical protein
MALEQGRRRDAVPPDTKSGIGRLTRQPEAAPVQDVRKPPDGWRVVSPLKSRTCPVDLSGMPQTHNFVTRYRDFLILGIALTAPVATFALLRLVPAADVLFQSVRFHLVVVSGVSACALIVAVLAAGAAGRVGNGSLTMLGAGCLTVGIFMLGHGLVTPGVADRPMNMWVGRFPVIAIAGFATFLALGLWRSGHESRGPVTCHPRVFLFCYALLAAGAVAAAVLWPAAGPGGLRLPGETAVRDLVQFASWMVLLAAGWGYHRRWLLGGDRVQFALTLACWLSAESLFSLRFGTLWRLSWWDYHVLLLTGFGGAVYAVIVEYRRLRVIDEVMAGVALHQPMQLIERGYPETLRALVAAVEAKDAHTHGHSARVAEMSVLIGRQMGFGPAQLRQLAQGAVLHDIGKIGTADAVLNKPGALTAEERAWIEEHPIAGWEIVRQAPSLRAALSVVRHHHERWDGRGYPDGLAGEAIPLPARIAAVADVWDALTSDRAYRAAWSAHRALDHIIAGSGTQFDPACVAAFVEALASNGLTPSGENGDAGITAAASTACHITVSTAGR